MNAGPFRKCHLQILRSLYDGPDGPEAGGGTSSGGSFDDGTGDTGGARENVPTDDGATAPDGGDAEGPVGGETWDLIEQFLRRRAEYRPHKERQVHWSNVSAAAQSRLDHLLSTTEEERKLSTQRPSSLTPRTPGMFSVSGRGTRSPTMSLTPLSSNRHAAGRLSQSEREASSTVPSWNFIGHMLQKRSRICTQSCEDYKSQPFLAEVREEAETRCKVLESVLKQLKMGDDAAHKQHNENKREGPAELIGAGKRPKLSDEAVRPTISSSLGQYLPKQRPEPSVNALDDNSGHNEDAIMETQMKLCLWSSLLSSVKEIVDES